MTSDEEDFAARMHELGVWRDVHRADLALTVEQQAAYDAMVAFIVGGDERTFCLFGLAGTGKTTLLARLAREFPHAALCTLTGKAASVLRRKTGLDAMTIHSYFYSLREKEVDQKTGKVVRMVWDRAIEDGRLDDQIVLIDECAMVGVGLMRDILATGARVIACGDPGQLWPVRDEPYFRTPDCELLEIHRQALDSPIIRQAHQVRTGERYVADGDAVQVHGMATDDDIVLADVLLCYTNRMRARLNDRARSLRGIWAVSPQAGEPVMCRQNVGRVGLYNGAIYTLVEPFLPRQTEIALLDDNSRVMRIGPVTFEGVEPHPSLRRGGELTWFQFGYACTVHKAAGSEWVNVTLFDDYFRSDADEQRRWLYTAITRAAERLVIIK